MLKIKTFLIDTAENLLCNFFLLQKMLSHDKAGILKFFNDFYLCNLWGNATYQNAKGNFH